jgi:hypothetical protein
LKSLLLMGGRGGGLLMDEAEWFALSSSFRNRTEVIARALTQGELALKNRALFLTNHLWSSAGPLWEELYKRVGPGARLVASADLVLADQDASVVVVDPNYALTRDVVVKLLSCANSGKVVVLPRSTLYTESSKGELEIGLAQNSARPAMDIDLGLSYRLHSHGEGKVILYDLPESNSAWQTFMASVLGVANVPTYCHLSDARLKTIPLEKRDGSLGVFILNGTNRSLAADLVFEKEVSVSDLALSLSPKKNQGKGGVVPANRFALEVPPCGILPISVAGLTTPKTAAPQPGLLANPVNGPNVTSPTKQDAKWNS